MKRRQLAAATNATGAAQTERFSAPEKQRRANGVALGRQQATGGGRAGSRWSAVAGSSGSVSVNPLPVRLASKELGRGIGGRSPRDGRRPTSLKPKLVQYQNFSEARVVAATNRPVQRTGMPRTSAASNICRGIIIPAAWPRANVLAKLSKAID